MPESSQSASLRAQGRKQFLQEVFPEELKEITRSREPDSDPTVAVIEKNLADVEQVEEKLQQARGTVAQLKQKNLAFRLNLDRFFSNQEVKDAQEQAKKLQVEVQQVKERLVPSTKLGLIGLAFSGGGIRSATFNLGVLQALAKNGILKHVHYLSTVSGGGYIGSCLSSLLNRPPSGPDWESFPFEHIPGEEEPAAMRQLRNGSNYLAPGGLLDKLRIPALLLRGILVNFLVFLPYLVLAAALTKQIYGPKLLSMTGLNWKTFYVLTPWVAAAFGIWILIFPLGQKILGIWGAKFNWHKRNRYELSFGMLLLMLILVVLAESLPVALLYLKLNWWEKGSGELWTWLTTAASFFPYAFAHRASGNVSRWTGKLALVVLGLLGPAILLLVYLRLSYWQVFSEASPFIQSLNWTVIYVGAFLLWLYTVICVDVNSTSLHGFYRDRLSKTYLFTASVPEFEISDAALKKLQAVIPAEITQKLEKIKDKDYRGKGRFLRALNKVLGLAATGLYKDLILESARVQPEKIQENDKQKLQNLNAENTRAPYHLVNVALNLQNADDPDLRGRNADFFTFSRSFSGSERTGYCPTVNLENTDAHLDLATAMAISGAAAAPNMGTTTIKPLVFIMTLLNIRLGYWLPNPRYIKTKFCRFLLSLGVGPIYLLKELLGRIDEKSIFVNVSDGGHLENLGIYELLRRRCKYIIAGDAEADADLAFNGLAKLIRYARIDMGINIDIELEDLQKDETGFSHKHCALGKIQYGGGETGLLLYIKSSLTGDENEYIQNYRIAHQDFPHESTADQFFDETQFEVYRALGNHIVEELLRSQAEVKNKLRQTEDIYAWFESMSSYLQPRFQMEESFIQLQNQLSEIEKQFADPDVRGYACQIYPEIASHNTTDEVSEAEADKCFAKIFHLCNRQMQLMENVYVALQLDNSHNRYHHFNRGWMNLFRRWAQASFFRHAWAISIGTYSAGFQRFCEESLNLGIRFRWTLGTEEELAAREKDYLANQIRMNRFVREQDQIWIARIVEPQTDAQNDRITVGFVTLRMRANETGVDTPAADLMFYRIREYFRQMKILEAIIPELKTEVENQKGKELTWRVDLRDIPAGQRHYDYFFERHGFQVVDDS